MPAHQDKATDAIIEKVIAYAKEHISAERFELFKHFVSLYYSHISYGDLHDREVADLYGAAFSQWELMYQRQPNELKIRIFNPHFEQHGWTSTHTIIQVAIENMPFLVDSMRMEINRLGLTTHFMIYMGGMRIARDKKGRVTEIAPYAISSNEGVVEAPIYMEIDRQTDPKVIADIEAHLKRVIQDVSLSVQDWSKMQTRLRETISELSTQNQSIDEAEVNEAKAFLEWLLRDHFTFLGARDYEVVGEGAQMALRLKEGSSLGVLRDESNSKIYRQISLLPSRVRELILSKEQVLMISKTNTRATVHRSAYTDYIGIKLFDENGQLICERRFIGLFTSAGYNAHPKAIPFLRQKVSSVLQRSGLPEKSHAGKDLMHILATLPRDDLFLAPTEDLYDLSMGILYLQERRQIRLFVRKDTYRRFVSCLVFIPRENFNTHLLDQIRDILVNAFHGLEVGFSTYFSESVLARVHYVIRIDPQRKLEYDIALLEKELVEVGRSWDNDFKDHVLDYFGEERGNKLYCKYRHSFPAGYREVFAPRNAAFDIDYAENVLKTSQLGMSFYRPVGVEKSVIRFKLFRLGHTVPLSDALPMLENMGLRVIGEQPYKMTIDKEQTVWINDFHMTYAQASPVNVEQVKDIFQDAFRRVWLGDAENDAFNRLVLEAQMNWREISLLRAYTKYLRQLGFTYSVDYIAETLIHNPSISKLLVELFDCQFNPAISRSKDHAERIQEQITEQLEEVAILDEDRILSRLRDVILATLRTNFYQKNPDHSQKTYISFKLNPRKIPDIPLPKPRYEIFVYSPQFEGVHLRATKVARGGIRWSDRREDFRTEVLGLMKAQQVKNAVIVPGGAKGGFVAKNMVKDLTREEIMQEGIACYHGFIQGMLDLADNYDADGHVVSPVDTVCYDEEDTYLVVAADKGTATFSDIANQIAIDRGFWLGDAFASGGCTGYDHKKMGITARGAWVSAERQFQELGINVDKNDITVVGIGDMAGDVFGNGMLMSPHIKLVGAFNHQHIFIDPDPDPAASYEERMRLFQLPRSSWTDYNAELISKGGGVFNRNLKAIRLSSEMKKLLDTKKDVMIPNDLIKALLKSQVDLLWNGGIGTFVKATFQTNEDVGDRTNDAIRIDAPQCRARVICEGGNLGITRFARIEYALNGGKINSDFIDNSAGVDCSDHEVNIKILLNTVIAHGDLTMKQRNAMLSRMTGEVAELVLQNNYHQNRTIGYSNFISPHHMNLFVRFFEDLEGRMKLNRRREALPDEEQLAQRRLDGKGLTKPEISTLMAYAKIHLESAIRTSDIPDNPDLAQFVADAFPTPLRKNYKEQMQHHRLRREIISTQLSNKVISDMGLTFPYQMYDETGASTYEIVCAYVAASRIFHMHELYADIESLDYKVDPRIQYEMIDSLIRLVRRGTRWLLRNRRDSLDIQEAVDLFGGCVNGLHRRLPKLLLGVDKEYVENLQQYYVEAGVPLEIAAKFSGTQPIYHTLNIVEAANAHDMDVYRVAKIYFILVERLDLAWFRDRINAYAADTRWVVLARSAYKADLDWIQRKLTMGVLNLDTKSRSVITKINKWCEHHSALIERWQILLKDLRSADSDEFAILSVAIRELSDLAESDGRQLEDE